MSDDGDATLFRRKRARDEPARRGACALAPSEVVRMRCIMSQTARNALLVLAVLAVVVGVAVYRSRNDSSASGARAAPPSSQPEGGSPVAGAPARLPRLVDLGAGKCIPCKKMAPILEELKREFAGRLEVEFIDLWENPRAGDPYQIRVIPAQIFYDAAGRELFRHEGFYSREDILNKWKELGVNLE